MANAVLIRHATWLVAGWGAWLLFVEGLIEKLDQPLPFTAFLRGAGGETRFIWIFTAWTAAALLLAVIAVRRDVHAD